MKWDRQTEHPSTLLRAILEGLMELVGHFGEDGRGYLFSMLIQEVDLNVPSS